MNSKNKKIIIFCVSTIMTLILLGIGALLIFSAKPTAPTAYAQDPTAIQDVEIGEAITVPPPLAPTLLPQEDVIIIKQNGESTTIIAEIATNRPDQAKGLMFRESMPEDAGMLFVFPEERELSFWMKNTLMPLDMIFINANGEIVHIHENAIPHDLKAHPSRYPAKAVLELNGGASNRAGIQIGDRIKHSAFNSNP